jgi:hypothetical protein
MNRNLSERRFFQEPNGKCQSRNRFGTNPSLFHKPTEKHPVSSVGNEQTLSLLSRLSGGSREGNPRISKLLRKVKLLMMRSCRTTIFWPNVTLRSPTRDTSYPIKVRALFMTHGEVGDYHFTFMFRNKWFSVWQPDKNLYSREQAGKLAESDFNSGQVEAYAKRQIQTWINVGDVY